MCGWEKIIKNCIIITDNIDFFSIFVIIRNVDAWIWTFLQTFKKHVGVKMKLQLEKYTD